MLTSPQLPQGPPPSRRRDVLLVALCAVVGAALGLGFFLVQSPTYTSEANVLVLPTAGGTDSGVEAGRTTPVQIQTEAAVAESLQVASEASDALGGRLGVETLRSNSTVTTTPNSEVLTFTFEASTAEDARDGAQALADAYLALRADAAAAAVDDATKVLRGEKAEAVDELGVLTDQLGLPGPPTDIQLQAEISLLVDQIADINSRLIALQVQSTGGGSVISAAPLPASPTSPVLWIDVVAGAVLGGLAGTGLVLLRQRRTDATRAGGPAEVDLTGMRETGVLAAPVENAVRVGPATSLAAPAAADPVSSDATSSGAVAAGGLRVVAALELDESGLVDGDQQAALHTLASTVAASHPGPVAVVGVDYPALMARASFALADAWQAIAGGAALVLAEPGSLVPAGRGAPPTRGLGDVLSGEWPSSSAVADTENGRAVLMGPGVTTAELPPATLRRRLAALWRDLEATYGTVLAQIQVPLDGALAQSVLQTTGPVVVVVKVGLSQQQDLAYAIEQLTWLGAADRVVGVVSVAGRPARRSSAAPVVGPEPTEVGQGTGRTTSGRTSKPKPDQGPAPTETAGRGRG